MTGPRGEPASTSRATPDRHLRIIPGGCARLRRSLAWRAGWLTVPVVVAVVLLAWVFPPWQRPHWQHVPLSIFGLCLLLGFAIPLVTMLRLRAAIVDDSVAASRVTYSIRELRAGLGVMFLGGAVLLISGLIAWNPFSLEMAVLLVLLTYGVDRVRRFLTALSTLPDAPIA